MDPNIQNDIGTILGDAQKLKLVLDNIKGQFSTDGKRSLEYTITNATTPAADQTHAVFSSDGLHMIYQEKIQYNDKQDDGGLNT
jgi:hypothetical protein